MVDVTSASTFIGITIFIEFEKFENHVKPEPCKFTEQIPMSSKINKPVFESEEVGRGQPFNKLYILSKKTAYPNKQHDL